MEAGGNINFLRSIPLFEAWPEHRLRELCRHGVLKNFQKSNSIVAEEGQPMKQAIFVKEGRLRIDKWIATEGSNYWPAGHNLWEGSSSKVMKKRKIVEIKEGSYFGLSGRDLIGDLITDHNQTCILMLPLKVLSSCKPSSTLLIF